MTHIKLQKINKQFGNTAIIQALDLSVVNGEFLTLVGPSGCGKSTLLRIIAGLEQQTSGHLFVEDVPVDDKKPSERDLAMVFQSYALYPHLTVFENIATPLRMRLLNVWQRLPVIRRCIPVTRQIDKKIHAQVTDVAETLGLTSLLDRKPGQLSGGQRQRVAVGRAIVRQPKAFLFDEPLSNLDAKLRVHMRAEITRLHQQLKTTFIYVTHDQAEAMTMSDRIAVMMEGQIVQVGTPEEVYRNPLDIRVARFIGSPEINILSGNIIDSDVIHLWGISINVPLCYSRQDAIEKGSAVALGLRAENIFLTSKNSPHCDVHMQGKVILVENLGAEVFVHVSLQRDNNAVIMRLSHKEAAGIGVDQMIEVGFLVEALFIFDSLGKRIDSITTQKKGASIPSAEINSPSINNIERLGAAEIASGISNV